LKDEYCVAGTSEVAGATCLCSSFNVPKVHWTDEAHRKDCGDLYVRFDSSQNFTRGILSFVLTAILAPKMPRYEVAP